MVVLCLESCPRKEAIILTSALSSAESDTSGFVLTKEKVISDVREQAGGFSAVQGDAVKKKSHVSFSNWRLRFMTWVNVEE